MKNTLVIYAHPDPHSFNSAIRNQVIKELKQSGTLYSEIDLYAINYNPVVTLEEVRGKGSEETKKFQDKISQATDIILIFPVFWFRAPAILEGFIDKTFVPGFAYRFKQIYKTFGVPIPLLSEKRVLTIMTHGAPALPVKTMYVNAVKYRFLLGFLSFCFNIFRCRIVQLWSVPFIGDKRREGYLEKVAVETRKLLKK